LRELGLCPSAQLLVQPTVQLDGSNQPRDHGAAPAVSLCERVMAWVFSLLPGAAAASVAIAGQRQPDAVGQKPQQSQPQHQQRQQRRQQQRRQQQPPQSGGPPGGGNHRAQGGSGDIRRRTANQRVARFRNSMDGTFVVWLLECFVVKCARLWFGPIPFKIRAVCMYCISFRNYSHRPGRERQKASVQR